MPGQLTSWEDVANFMRNVNRIRFYSHCLPEVSKLKNSLQQKMDMVMPFKIFGI